VSPAAKTAERPIGAPSATGPTSASPESNTRIGRARHDHEFARLRGDIMSVPASTELAEADSA
jgi:hypothetical protein